MNIPQTFLPHTFEELVYGGADNGPQQSYSPELIKSSDTADRQGVERAAVHCNTRSDAAVIFDC
ncbi:MAG: hypothetical protein A2293_12820 [Elusimicrobia bacterium RIFOXYB2_FULL_49_7]|nr:MAG: hypothetical protein A2293_12820 [Elusimicrobia bacterium RIFOXYB2_FULL_49_7]